MRKLLFIVAALICFTSKSRATTKLFTINTSATADSIHKKIVHPKIAMSDVQLNAILGLMRTKRNDAEKIVVLKAGVKDKGITVEQLTQLLNQFLTDDSKLTCAEYAYQYTVNYKAYLDLQNLFSSEEPKDKLEYYIKEHK